MYSWLAVVAFMSSLQNGKHSILLRVIFLFYRTSSNYILTNAFFQYNTRSLAMGSHWMHWQLEWCKHPYLQKPICRRYPELASEYYCKSVKIEDRIGNGVKSKIKLIIIQVVWVILDVTWKNKLNSGIFFSWKCFRKWINDLTSCNK